MHVYISLVVIDLLFDDGLLRYRTMKRHYVNVILPVNEITCQTLQYRIANNEFAT